MNEDFSKWQLVWLRAGKADTDCTNENLMWNDAQNVQSRTWTVAHRFLFSESTIHTTGPNVASLEALFAEVTRVDSKMDQNGWGAHQPAALFRN